LTLVLLLTLSAGALYGKFSQRWGPPVDLVAAAARLETLPVQLGDWKMTEQVPIAKSVAEMLQCAGSLHRRYVHTPTGRVVDFAIIAGPPGPTAVHTPEICYSSRVHDLIGERQSVEINSSSGGPHSFWRNDFSTKNPLADNLRVYYAWSPGRAWEASKSPRYKYAADPLLYKIQLASTVRAGTKDDSTDSCREFLEAFLQSGWPVVQRH